MFERPTLTLMPGELFTASRDSTRDPFKVPHYRSEQSRDSLEGPERIVRLNNNDRTLLSHAEKKAVCAVFRVTAKSFTEGRTKPRSFVCIRENLFSPLMT